MTDEMVGKAGAGKLLAALVCGAVLIGLSAFSYAIGGRSGAWSNSAILLFCAAGLKILLIGLVFMELAHAPRFLRRVFLTYCAVLSVGLVALSTLL